MKPEDQAAAWAKKRQKIYMQNYRKAHREQLRAKQRAYYRAQREKKENGETRG